MMRILLAALPLIASLGGCSNASSGYRQAMLYLHHNRVEEALLLLQPLAANGVAPAQYQLALLQHQQAKKWNDAALEDLDRAARAGHLGARYQLALAQQENGVAEKAEQGLQSLAREGFVPAQFDLAQLLELRSEADALNWLKRAAEAGHEGAIKRLVRVYEHGELGQAKDDKQAAAWRELLVAKKF